MIDQKSLVEICSVFNRNSVQYVIIGGYACALNGHIRATNDIDILLKDDEINLKKSLECIKELLPDINEELNINDIRDNIVLKIIDDFEIDLSIKAWVVDYEEALNDIMTVTIDEVRIPYLGLDTLIKSKSTSREIDMWDVKVLSMIKNK